MPVNSRSRDQLMLYVDIVVLGVAALALVAAVHNAYYAGYWAGRLPGAADSRSLWMTVNIVALVLSAAWFLTRFYRARVKELARA